ncbi:MAG: SCO family protein [Gammaproteobacteria bacterium]
MNNPQPEAQRRFPALLFILAVAALAAGIWLGQWAARKNAPPVLVGATLLPQPKALAPYRLVDFHGAPFGPQQMRGKWTFLFFGYTHCPDVCPSALALLNRVTQRLRQPAGVAEETQVVFISVDPQRDKPAVLARFVPYFNKDFIGATGSPDEIAKLTRQVGVVYARSGESGDDYVVDHSASILLLDPQGRYTALFSAPQDPDTMVSDFLKIRGYYEDL